MGAVSAVEVIVVFIYIAVMYAIFYVTYTLCDLYVKNKEMKETIEVLVKHREWLGEQLEVYAESEVRLTSVSIKELFEKTDPANIIDVWPDKKNTWVTDNNPWE